MASNSKTVAITMGDPSGVGPELLAALIDQHLETVCSQSIILADKTILDRAFIQRTGRRLPDSVPVLNRGSLSADQAIPGRPSEAGARAQAGYLEAAVHAVKSGTANSIVTAPVSKTQCRAAGLEFPGQTEFFADRFGVEHVAMTFVTPDTAVVLATTHVPVRDVGPLLSVQRIRRVIDIALPTLENRLLRTVRRLGILGLNPHAGEQGLIGREEIDVIAPAIAELRIAYPDIHITGPLVPDAVFRLGPPTLDRPNLDLIVAMYHDQALIPLKALYFETAVHVTSGLPIVRTSPDHGVAYDIAGTGRVNTAPFFAAFELARKAA